MDLRVFQRCLTRHGKSLWILGLALCLFPSPLPAEEPILGYVENGRVIFTNEGTSYIKNGKIISSTTARTSLLAVSTPSNAGTLNIHRLIDGTSRLHGVDPELVKAVVQVESNFNPNALSYRGAMGLMQLIPATAKRFGVRNAFDPAANLDGGVRYLKYLLRYFDGDLRLALAAYNAGENLVSRLGRIPPYPETRNYIQKIGMLYPLDGPVRTNSIIQRIVDRRGWILFSNTGMP